MTHLDEGVLRRMQDEPGATSAADILHFESCDACRRRATVVGSESTRALALLAVPAERVEPSVALLRLRRLVGDNVATSRVGRGRVRQGRAFRPLAAGALTLGLMATLVVSGVAEKAVQVFEPQHFAVVNVNPASLGSLPDLSQFGTYTVAQQPRFRSAPGLTAALTASGLKSVLSPQGPLPAAVKGQPTYETFTQAQGSFTFQSDKARAYAASKGKALPAMPAGVDGTTVTATAGPGVLTIYGTTEDGAGSAPATPPTPREKPGLRGFRIPSLAIVQMTTPRVQSTGAPVKVLESYLASLPGVPADLAAQIEAIGDPASTLPVPVPTGQGSKEVLVNGSKGLFVGDSTGLGAGVIWQKDGVLYAVVGTLGETEVVNIARSLS
ncbi:MAG: hypothetical protein ABR573_09645 [Candidatus Dormibacteria bacterium]